MTDRERRVYHYGLYFGFCSGMALIAGSAMADREEWWLAGAAWLISLVIAGAAWYFGCRDD